MMDHSYIEVKLKAFLVYVLVAIVFLGSCLLNLDKGESFQNIGLNFAPPALILFYGLSVKGIPKWTNYLAIFLGGAFLIYLSLYYLIGFHNHHWGN